MRNVSFYLLCVAAFAVGFFSSFLFYKQQAQPKQEHILEERVDTLSFSKGAFFKVCSFYEIKCPEIVYCQSLLESGHFKSNLFKSKNNFLGLYDSSKKEFFKFSHWSDCVRGYKNSVQYKYTKDTCSYEDYFAFLDEINYAEDPDYIRKVRILMKQHFAY